jgi:hypothetical protein
MNILYARLETDLTIGLKRWRRSRWQRGMAVSLLGLLLLCGLVMLAAPTLAVFPAMFWFVLGTAALGWVALTIQYLILPLRHRPNLTQIARYLEEQNPELEDRLATALEFGRQAPNFSAKEEEPHPLLHMLLQDAVTRTAKIDIWQQLQIRFAGVWRSLAVVSAVLALIAFFGYSGAFRQKLQQYYATVQNAPKILAGLQVSPGDARIRRGETVEVVAQSSDAAADKASIYVAAGKASAPVNEESWSPTDMEPTTLWESLPTFLTCAIRCGMRSRRQ